MGSIISFRGVAGYHICCKTEGPRFETGRKHASILGLFASKRRQWKDQINSSKNCGYKSLDLKYTSFASCFQYRKSSLTIVDVF